MKESGARGWRRGVSKQGKCKTCYWYTDFGKGRTGCSAPVPRWALLVSDGAAKVGIYYPAPGDPPDCAAWKEAEWYCVTCPDCGAKTVTRTVVEPLPGGIAPVVCSGCGQMILSMSEGDPERCEAPDADVQKNGDHNDR